MSELEDVREQLVQRLEQGDALSGKEILATTAGGALVAAGLIVVLAGAAAPSSPGTIAVGLSMLVLAALALAPWLRRQRALWRDVVALRRRVRALQADLPPGAAAGAGVLRRYYRRRLAPPVVAVAVVAGWLLAVRLSR
jgi:heme exporter protein D